MLTHLVMDIEYRYKVIQLRVSSSVISVTEDRPSSHDDMFELNKRRKLPLRALLFIDVDKFVLHAVQKFLCSRL